MRNRHNGGFTLVELLVTIVVGSIVTLAATTVLLMGLRMNNSFRDTIAQQNDTRLVLSIMDQMASRGNIASTVSDAVLDDAYNSSNGQDWTLLDADNNTLFHYSTSAQALYAGNQTDTPLMEGIEEFSAEWTEHNLLTLSITTADGAYKTSIHCRTLPEPLDDFTAADGTTPEVEDITDPSEIPENERAARIAFIQMLASQYQSRGQIINPDGTWGKYYATWYNEKWPGTTPWCACYVSWALDQISDQVNAPENYAKWFANVDYFLLYLMEDKEETASQNKWKNAGETPLPGDLIFFDWTVDDTIDPAHIGVVLTEQNGYIYTIEGNSNNMVAVRRYLKTDPRILGYGVLDWVETEPDSTEPTA